MKPTDNCGIAPLTAFLQAPWVFSRVGGYFDAILEEVELFPPFSFLSLSFYLFEHLYGHDVGVWPLWIR